MRVAVLCLLVEFLSGYAGTVPKDARDKARTYFNMPAVRALLARLESGRATEADVTSALTGSEATLADLLRLRLLRKVDDRYAIGFAYFTADDMRTIYKAADRVAPSLAAAFVAHRKDFDRIFAAYPTKSVPRSQIAFVLLTGFCLNWDGLRVTSDFGYRKPIIVDGPAFHYSFWASEEVRGRDYRGVIWEARRGRAASICSRPSAIPTAILDSTSPTSSTSTPPRCRSRCASGWKVSASCRIPISESRRSASLAIYANQ